VRWHDLRPGQFIAVEVKPPRRFGRRRAGDVEDEWLRQGQGYWIAQTADAGDGSCVVQKFLARGTLSGTRFERGEVAIAIKWWDRVPADSRGLSFAEWDAHDYEDTQLEPDPPRHYSDARGASDTRV